MNIALFYGTCTGKTEAVAGLPAKTAPVAPTIEEVVEGLPDMIVRENNLRGDLALLAGQIGKKTMPPVPAETDPLRGRLAAIYDSEIEAAAKSAYQRDYLTFGFGDWSPTA